MAIKISIDLQILKKKKKNCFQIAFQIQIKKPNGTTGLYFYSNILLNNINIWYAH